MTVSIGSFKGRISLLQEAASHSLKVDLPFLFVQINIFKNPVGSIDGRYLSRIEVIELLGT